MKVSRVLFGFVLCLAFISTVSSPVFALSKRPPTQHDENGNFTPNPFAEADALRYGGLFGPLPDPEELVPDFTFMGRNRYLTNVDTRALGFASDEPHYIAITRKLDY